MTNDASETYDVVVIGAGPAGGASATICAQSGLRTLLVEREAMPRFHVGESLMPECYWPLQRLGLTDRVAAAGWQPKKSVQFVTHDGRESDPFFFSEHDDRDCSTTWQVERAEFDQMLFDRAAECGADTRDRTRVTDVHFDGDRATGVTIRTGDEPTRRIGAKVVIDATGQQSLIANRLGLKQINPDLKKAAIWTYYRDAARGDGDNEGATVILHTEDQNAWFWFIPQSRGITSVGCVSDNDYLLKGRGTPAEVFAEELARCPGLGPRLKGAERVGEVRVAKEFSYMTRRHAGEGWVLVGDALGFIDPVYSSGVYFALEMGVRAGDAVVEGFKADDLSPERLSSWCDEFKEGVRWVRGLVNAFYDRDFSLGRFLKDHPEHRGNVTDLLIGRVFHENAGNLFDDLQASLQRQRSRRGDSASAAGVSDAGVSGEGADTADIVPVAV